MTPAKTTICVLVAEARDRFVQAGLSDPAIDARILVAGIIGLTTTELWMRGDDSVGTQAQAAVRAAIERRLRHEPVHRILGHRDFYGLDLKLSPGTLEPRSDTEILVDRILPHLKAIAADKGTARILDLGTGTGAICLALLHECRQATGIGSDISADALATAAANAHFNAVGERFTPVESRWFEDIAGIFDIIVSNPPYIASSVISTLEPEVKDFDPLAALDGGADGLDAYRSIAAGAKRHLAPDGFVGVEIGFDQKAPVTDIFARHDFHLVEAAQDYGGNDRALVFVCNTRKG